MSSIHRKLEGRRARAWRTLLVVAALGAVTTVSTTATASGPSDVTGVILSGPTGVRSGVPVTDPGTPPDAATIAPFDTFGRDPRLAIAGEADDAWVSWQVSAIPAAEPAAEPVSLGAGVAEVPIETIALSAPVPGDWLVTADLVGGPDGPTGTWAWHLVIPDRSLPESMPAPDVVLFGGGRTVAAHRESGCYLGECGDIGGLPPDRILPMVRLTRPDEPVAVTLSDGSDIAALRVEATRLNVDETRPVTLLAGDQPAGTNVVLIPAPPSSGRWRLELFLTFSDGRGDQTAYTRVTVP